MADNLIMKNGQYMEIAVPAGVTSGDPFETGEGLHGVATKDRDSDGNASVDLGPAVYDLSVKGIDDDGNSAVAVGEQLYITDADTPKISKKRSGNFFGFALETVTSGATATINVLILPGVGPGTADILAGVIGTSELAADCVDGTKIADDSIDSEHYVDGSIDTAHVAADAVDGTLIADDAVSLEHLDSGIEPSHVVKYAGNKTTTGGAAAEDLAVAGVLATDVAIVTVQDDGTNNVTLIMSVAATDKITCTFSGDPGNDCIVNYLVLRAAA